MFVECIKLHVVLIYRIFYLMIYHQYCTPVYRHDTDIINDIEEFLMVSCRVHCWNSPHDLLSIWPQEGGHCCQGSWKVVK